MNKIISSVLFVFVVFNAYSQNITIWPSINGLTEFDIPKEGSNEWIAFIQSRYRYFISNNGEISIIDKEKEHKEYVEEWQKTGSRSTISGTLEENGGKFVGLSFGEWGGRLLYRKGGNESLIINNRNIIDVFKYNNEIYVLSGLTHLGGSSGELIKLMKKDDLWDIDYTIDLGKCPTAFMEYKGILYIATYNGLIMFDEFEINEIVTDQPWHSYKKDSLFIRDNIIAIGLGGCVAIINKNDYSIKTYK